MALVKRTGLVIADRYRLERQLGAGAMGTVWAAQDLASAQRVAVKFMSEEKPDLRARFVREAKLSKRLSHPNIVTTFDLGETNEGEPFLVQECLTGPTLEQKLKADRRLDPREAVRIVRDMALGVAAAHAAEIMHRDLKPANVMLHDERGTGTELVVKILDFGIAKSTGSENQTYATVAGMTIGSHSYMSPEGLIGRGVDRRTDLWALGVILYELIVGLRPFVGTQTEVTNQIFAGETPSISDKMRDAPVELDRVVLVCIERNRDKRLSSAAELASILTQILESPAVWRSEPVKESKPADADGDKTLLYRPRGTPVLPVVLPESAGPSFGGVETVIREAPVITSSSRRRRELRLLVGVTAGVFIGAVGVLVLGLALGWFSNESKNSAEVGPTEPSAKLEGSTNSLEDKPVQPVAVKLDPTNEVPSVPAAPSVAPVSSVKPVVTAAKKKKVESKSVAVPF